MNEKTHPATPGQRRRFQESGDVARSRDAVAVAVLLAAACSVAVGAGSVAASLARLTRAQLDGLSRPVTAALAADIATAFVGAVAPTLALTCCLAIVMGMAQNRWVIPWKALKLDLQRLDPMPRLQQTFFSADAAVGLLNAIGKVSVLGTVLAVTLVQKLPPLMQSRAFVHGDYGLAARFILVPLVVRGAVAMLVLAAIDYGLAWARTERKMRMSAAQVRDDMKEELGDPVVRQRRRAKQLELARERSLKQVPKADVVLVNPTHYAVALRYEARSMNAPTVVARGCDHLAERIRAIARKHAVPVVSNPPLARMLYKSVKVGREVPPGLYHAVAVVLAQVYRARGRVA